MKQRPQITEEIITEVAKKTLMEMGREVDDNNIRALVDEFHPGIDGFDLAIRLHESWDWEIDSMDVETLDCMSTTANQLHQEAQFKWAEENNIAPPHPIGTRIRQGVITEVHTHSAATYLVKENGSFMSLSEQPYIYEDPADGKGTRRLLVRFEDAVPVTD